MTVTLKSFIIAILLLILSVIVYRFAQVQNDKVEQDLSYLPTFKAFGVNGAIYNKKGSLNHTVNSITLEYYDKKKLLNLEKPLIESYKYNTNGSVEKWLLSGDIGNAVIGKNAKISGHVNLYPGFSHPQIKIINANYLIYDFKKDIVTSKDRVTIEGHNWVNTGINFKADLRNNIISYKGSPNVTYYPQ